MFIELAQTKGRITSYQKRYPFLGSLLVSPGLASPPFKCYQSAGVCLQFFKIFKLLLVFHGGLKKPVIKRAKKRVKCYSSQFLHLIGRKGMFKSTFIVWGNNVVSDKAQLHFLSGIHVWHIDQLIYKTNI